MVAPSKSFTVIADSSVDADSPVTVTLMTSLRDNDIHLEEWLGFSFTAAQDHDHDGVNSKAVDISLVFDQTTAGSGDPPNATFIDLATITVASADLIVNRDALIIGSGNASHLTSGGGTVRLLVDGVAKQSVLVRDAEISAGVPTKTGFALSEIVNLTSGSDRIIKVQGNETASDISYENVNLFSVLIT